MKYYQKDGDTLLRGPEYHMPKAVCYDTGWTAWASSRGPDIFDELEPLTEDQARAFAKERGLAFDAETSVSELDPGWWTSVL